MDKITNLITQIIIASLLIILGLHPSFELMLAFSGLLIVYVVQVVLLHFKNNTIINNEAEQDQLIRVLKYDLKELEKVVKIQEKSIIDLKSVTKYKEF